MAAISVFLVDNQALFRDSLGVMLAAADSFVVVGGAGDAATAARQVPTLQPDVIVLELLLPDCRNADAVEQVLAAHPHGRVLVLTELADEGALAAAVAAGAHGYILKSQPAAALIAAIHTVARGGVALDPAAAAVIWQRLQQLARREGASLSPILSRPEQDVLRLLAAGKSTRQIAETFALSPAVVEQAITGICMKLQARNRTEAVVLALKRGLVSPL